MSFLFLIGSIISCKILKVQNVLFFFLLTVDSFFNEFCWHLWFFYDDSAWILHIIYASNLLKISIIFRLNKESMVMSIMNTIYIVCIFTFKVHLVDESERARSFYLSLYHWEKSLKTRSEFYEKSSIDYFKLLIVISEDLLKIGYTCYNST